MSDTTATWLSFGWSRDGKTDTLTFEEFIRSLAMFSDEEVEDFIIAVRAAEKMADRWQQDVAILPDFRVVPLKTNHEPPLEIVRYSQGL